MKIIQMSPSFNRGLPLVREITGMKNPTVDKVKEMYGNFGVDLYSGKTHPSLIKQRPKSKNPITNLINKVKDHFSKKAEFEPDDTMFRIVNKYIYNEKSGLTSDIKEKFGRSGLKVLDQMKTMGYIV